MDFRQLGAAVRFVSQIYLGAGISNSTAGMESTGIGVAVTPKLTGNVYIHADVTCYQSSTTQPTVLGLAYNTTGIPSGGSSPGTDTSSHTFPQYSQVATGEVSVPVGWVVTGLSLGTTYYFYIIFAIGGGVTNVDGYNWNSHFRFGGLKEMAAATEQSFAETVQKIADLIGVMVREDENGVSYVQADAGTMLAAFTALNVYDELTLKKIESTIQRLEGC